MRRVAVVSSAHTDYEASDPNRGTAEMAFDVAKAAVEATGLARADIGLTVSASSDMLEGRSFNFVQGLEALGTWPPVNESHLEMDGAWAAYYAWLRIISGDVDSALVCAWGKSSEGSLHHVLNTQLDPFCLAPLGLDYITTAALQADAFSARTGLSADATPPRFADGACAVVLAAQGVAERVSKRPAWIAGADHRAESGSLGHRDLSRATAAALAMTRAREMAGWEQPEWATLGGTFAHQKPMLVEALGLADGVQVEAPDTEVLMVTGLDRLSRAASRITSGDSRRSLAHGATGHAMQQHIVWLLEAA
jgi:hypothetical protein